MISIAKGRLGDPIGLYAGANRLMLEILEGGDGEIDRRND
jgi:hypothetical protein